LVYFEVGGDALAAIEREKQIKSWVRRRKIALVAAQNPKWKDLSAFDCPAQPAATAEGDTACHSERQRRI
jgi:putative endonuclease